MAIQTSSGKLYRLFSHLVLIVGLLLTGFEMVPVRAVWAADLTVDSLLDNENDGCSLGACTLREPIAEAAAGQSIDFSVTGNLHLAGGELVIDKDLTITGPHPDTFTIDAGNASRIFFITNAAHVAISRMTLTNGQIGDMLNFDGGAIYLDTGASLNLRDAAITASSASRYGGAIVALGASLTVSGAVLDGNQAGSSGGAIYAQNGILNIEYTTISNNHSGAAGGGINTSANATVNTSTFSDNSTLTDGGGIANQSSLAIHQSTFSGNQANGSGGGIASFSPPFGTTTLNVVASTITGNTADFNSDSIGAGGGVSSDLQIFGSGADAYFNRSIVAGNNNPYDSASADCYHDDLNPMLIFQSQGYNLMAQAAGCPANGTTDLTPASPLSQDLEPSLADLGGPTHTHGLPGSIQAIEAVPIGAKGCSASEKDQRSAQRANGTDAGGTDAGGSACDIGAFELSETYQRDVSGANLYRLDKVVLDITTPGSLTQFTIVHVPSDHPAATTMNGSQYWTITPSGNGTVNLTLPHTVAMDSNAQVCRYTGGAGAGWDCERTRSTQNMVTRENVSTFSDWAVGDNTDPTAVQLVAFQAQSDEQFNSILAIGILGVLGIILTSLKLRSLQNRQKG